MGPLLAVFFMLSGAGARAADAPAAVAPAAFRLESPAFGDGGDLPLTYACGGNPASPPLRWNDPPAGTRSFAVVFVEPLTGTMRAQWVVYRIPATARGLESRHLWLARSADGTLQGRNSADRTGYAPPCLRTRHARAYRLVVFALDFLPRDRPGDSLDQLVSEIKGRVLAQAALSVNDRR